MQFKQGFSKKLKLPIVIEISKTLLIAFVVLSLFGFTEFNTDNLYPYQWGMKNNGNFVLERDFLRNTYKPLSFHKITNDMLFFDNKLAIDYLLATGIGEDKMLPQARFDMDWESAYLLFNNKPNKNEVIVALLDTGVDVLHYELARSIWKNENEIPENGIDDDNNGYVDDVYGYNFNEGNNYILPVNENDVHGTHNAGIMVAEHNNGGIKGIAYNENIKLMTLKVLDEEENGFMSSVIEAIKYAKNNGASICNISLGAYIYDKNIDEVIRENPDMLFIVSAGNGKDYIGYSLDERDVYPAKLEYANVITVSNAAFDGTRYESANYGSYVDVFAPGTFILSTAPNNSFAYLTGTSMASPFVAATCAMIKSLYPNIPISEYKNLIIGGASDNIKLNGLSKSAGILNAYNTLRLAGTY